MLSASFLLIFLILSTLFILCGQVVKKLSSVDKFIVFSIFDKPLFYKGLRGYLPQQFLYFLPEPHGHGSFLPILGSLFITVWFCGVDVFGAIVPSKLLIAQFCNPSPVILTVSSLFMSPSLFLACIKNLTTSVFMSNTIWSNISNPSILYCTTGSF